MTNFWLLVIFSEILVRLISFINYVTVLSIVLATSDELQYVREYLEVKLYYLDMMGLSTCLTG